MSGDLPGGMDPLEAASPQQLDFGHGAQLCVLQVETRMGMMPSGSIYRHWNLKNRSQGRKIEPQREGPWQDLQPHISPILINSSADIYVTFFFDRPSSSPMAPMVNITAGSLDPESLQRLSPERHGWWDDGVDWIKHILRQEDEGFLER
jgi:hypothetical protein